MIDMTKYQRAIKQLGRLSLLGLDHATSFVTEYEKTSWSMGMVLQNSRIDQFWAEYLKLAYIFPLYYLPHNIFKYHVK